MAHTPADIAQPATGKTARGGDARHKRRSSLAAIILTGIVAAALPIGPAAASTPRPFTFHVTIGQCFWIQAPGGADAVVTWSASNGSLKATFSQRGLVTGRIDGLGYCGLPHPAVSIGDRIRVSAAGLTRTFKVPVLTAAFDTARGLLKGTGPVSSRLAWQAASPQMFPAGSCGTWARIYADGTYSVDIRALSGMPYCPTNFVLKGGDSGLVRWTSPSKDQVFRMATVPFIDIASRESTVSGAAAAGTPVTITVRDSGGTVLGYASGHADASGSFNLVARGHRGNEVFIQAGDRVVGDWAGAAAVTVPDVHFSALPVYHWIYGWCMPDARYWLELDYESGSSYTGGITDDSGETALWQVNGHVKSGETMRIVCQFDNGDQVTSNQVIP